MSQEISTAVGSTLRESIDHLQAEVLKLEQPQFETEHYWAGGMYCRVLPRQAGTVIIGKTHRQEHFYLVLSGTVLITNGDKAPIEVTGPKVIVSQPGTRRAVYAKTDAVCATVHRTSETDLERLDAELCEPAPESTYLPGNALKRLRLL